MKHEDATLYSVHGIVIYVYAQHQGVRRVVMAELAEKQGCETSVTLHASQAATGVMSWMLYIAKAVVDTVRFKDLHSPLHELTM